MAVSATLSALQAEVSTQPTETTTQQRGVKKPATKGMKRPAAAAPAVLRRPAAARATMDAPESPRRVELGQHGGHGAEAVAFFRRPETGGKLFRGTHAIQTERARSPAGAAVKDPTGITGGREEVLEEIIGIRATPTCSAVIGGNKGGKQATENGGAAAIGMTTLQGTISAAEVKVMAKKRSPRSLQLLRRHGAQRHLQESRL
eukprot:s1349_g23.t1